jgi:transposase
MGRQARLKEQRRTAKQHEVPLAELAGIVERAKRAALDETDYATLKTAIDTLAFLTQELSAKGASIERLRKLIFGASTEKTSRIVGSDEKAKPPRDSDDKPKARGHGRNGAAAYTGAKRIKVPHAALHHGDACPECHKGKIYPSCMRRHSRVFRTQLRHR